MGVTGDEVEVLLTQAMSFCRGRMHTVRKGTVEPDEVEGDDDERRSVRSGDGARAQG